MEFLNKQNILTILKSIESPIDGFVVTEKINILPTTQIVYCKDCVFHMDCEIEKILPNTNIKFCSYGKQKG